MTREQLIQAIESKKSLLCVGLDPDLKRIPKHLLAKEDPVFEFNKVIIDHTLPFTVAYKPNIAFYESLGSAGWKSLERTIAYLPDDVFKIADAKRGDIGNTSRMYAEAFFDHMNFDAVTISPYMGKDSVTPFMMKGKWVIILAATSNEGSLDFQHLELNGSREKLYEKVIHATSQWGSSENTMFVIGATRSEVLKKIRDVCPDHFLLIPGVGAQGGDLDLVCQYGLNDRYGLLINSARSIIYASGQEDFGVRAGEEAKKLQKKMAQALIRYKH